MYLAGRPWLPHEHALTGTPARAARSTTLVGLKSCSNSELTQSRRSEPSLVIKISVRKVQQVWEGINWCPRHLWLRQVCVLMELGLASCIDGRGIFVGLN
mmetsp:Transcript_25707/g.34784  ORF Transcript_25707/g.34784 Transcript_25707/m.34784 type:complete len:100 (+) Transcript_25707:268-567(+)